MVDLSIVFSMFTRPGIPFRHRIARVERPRIPASQTFKRVQLLPFSSAQLDANGPYFDGQILLARYPVGNEGMIHQNIEKKEIFSPII